MARPLLIAIDLLLVLVFAVIGRASHGEALDVAGIATTAWPFLAACLVGWLVISMLGTDGLGARPAVIVWLVTVLGGLALRLVTGATAALPFVVVATIVLALFLFGWRLIAWAIRRRKDQSASATV